MKLKRLERLAGALFAACVAICLTATAPAALNFDWLTVGDTGNVADTSGFGAVSYEYSIGKYDITLAQYATFLNAVAKADPNGLYYGGDVEFPGLANDLNIAGIARTGSDGSYTYTVIDDGQRPVTYVNMLDAMRFANWVNNGQPTGAQGPGTTEDGAYTLGPSPTGFEVRNPGAKVVIPSENEWYKAAYYDPNKNGQGVGGYWLYATKSDTTPGNVVGPDLNQANYLGTSGFSVTQSNALDSSTNYLTPVGAFSGSASAYGTFDQSGNVFQWTEGILTEGDTVVNRVVRGGSWSDDDTFLPSSFFGGSSPDQESATVGFRLASVPEPSTIVLFGIGCGVLAARRRRPARQ